MFLREQEPGGVESPGGSISRLSGDIYGETAYLAYYFHWSRRDVLDMSRNERRRWLAELEKINNRINSDTRNYVEALRADQTR